MYQEMVAFKFSFRYIDDLAFINNHFIFKFLNPDQPCVKDNPLWIYPLHIIQLKHTNQFIYGLPSETVFLCTKFLLTKPFLGDYNSSLHWKKDKLPCNNVSYLFLDSNRPINQCYNICISQLLPIMYSASHCFLAYQDIFKLIHTLAKNGFYNLKLINICIKHISTNNYPGLRFNKNLLLQFLKT